MNFLDEKIKQITVQILQEGYIHGEFSDQEIGLHQICQHNEKYNRLEQGVFSRVPETPSNFVGLQQEHQTMLV